MNISIDKWTSIEWHIFRYLLELDGEFTLPHLIAYVASYIDIKSRVAQDDRMLFEVVINNFLLEGKCKVYNRSTDFHVMSNKSGTTHKCNPQKLGLQTHSTIMKEMAVLVNLLEIWRGLLVMWVSLTHTLSRQLNFWNKTVLKPPIFFTNPSWYI